MNLRTFFKVLINFLLSFAVTHAREVLHYVVNGLKNILLIGIVTSLRFCQEIKYFKEQLNTYELKSWLKLLGC